MWTGFPYRPHRYPLSWCITLKAVLLELAGVFTLHKSTIVRSQGSRSAAKGELMPQFAVFFSDRAGFCIEMVQAQTAGQVWDIARAQHPAGRLSAVLAELVEDQDKHKLLKVFIRQVG